MASITQTIPGYVGGISQQPDELKYPGQVKDALNVLPDVTHGLLKRPGGRLIGSLSDNGNAALNSSSTGQWFHYYRDENEQYIGQIARDGKVKMWACVKVLAANGSTIHEAGAPVTVKFNTTLEKIDVTAAGSGYTSAPTVAIAAPTEGEGTDVQATATATLEDDGVLSVTLTNKGNGYLVNPAVTFSGGGGSSAAATASAQNVKLTTYLTHTADDDVQTLSLNDVTFICNRNIKPVMETATDPDTINEAFIELKKVAYASQYALNIYKKDDPTIKVTTATRISVHRTHDTKNICGGDSTTYDNTLPPSGTTTAQYLIGTGADQGANCEAAAGLWRDSYCPNVDERIFNVTYNDYIDGTIPDTAENIDYNGVSYFINKISSASVGSTTADNQTFDTRLNDALDASRSNLVFRITTTGQATPYNNGAAGDGAAQIYQCRYTTTHDLLYGGEGWKTGDTFNVWMNRARYRITVEEHSESEIKAKIGGNVYAIRPKPTSFDSNTVVTAESILGDIAQEIAQVSSWGFQGNGSDTDRIITGISGVGYESGTAGVSTDEDDYIVTLDGIPTTAFTIAHAGDPAVTTITFTSAPGKGVEIRIRKANEFQGSQGTIEQIGNGLYIKRNGTANKFSISTPANDLLNVMTNSIKDIADLPRQCKNGYKIKIANSEEEEDDYWMKFIGRNGEDGEGIWEETTEPGRDVAFNKGTMPIRMNRNADGTFTVEQINWEDCLVGDTTTVKVPSFIDAGKTINKMLFFRNRLIFLSDEDVVMSKAGDFFNFWPKTAVTYANTDPIDIEASSGYPAILYDGVQVNQGLVLFSKNEQFMLTTDSDVLSVNTAKINTLSTYNFNTKTQPFSLGTTVGFLDNAGKNTRFFEMDKIAREGKPDVIEQSKVVSKLFPKNIDLVANSRENSVIFFSEKDKDIIYGYRYFSSIEKRIQSAWFRWSVSGNIQHLAMLDDALYAVIRNTVGTTHKDVLQKFCIKQEDSSNILVEDYDTTDTSDDIEYRINLDNAAIKSTADGDFVYDATNNWTKFNLPTGFYSDKKLSAVTLPTGDDKTFQGLTAEVHTFIEGGVTKVKLPGNWKTYDPQEVEDGYTGDDVTPAGNIVLGYVYDMEVKFPTIYYLKPVGDKVRAETQGSLVVHRIKFNFGPLGVYETRLDRVGKASYTELYEAVIADAYNGNDIQYTPDSFKTIPVYEKNVNLTLTLKSSHPSPATLYSMTWEGDYTNKYYQRV